MGGAGGAGAPQMRPTWDVSVLVVKTQYLLSVNECGTKKSTIEMMVAMALLSY